MSPLNCPEISELLESSDSHTFQMDGTKFNKRLSTVSFIDRSQKCAWPCIIEAKNIPQRNV